MDVAENRGIIEISSNSIPDHNAWSISSDTIQIQNVRVQFPTAPKQSLK